MRAPRKAPGGGGKGRLLRSVVGPGVASNTALHAPAAVTLRMSNHGVSSLAWLLVAASAR